MTPDPTDSERWTRGHPAGGELATAETAIALAIDQLAHAWRRGDWSDESMRTVMLLGSALEDGQQIVAALARAAADKSPEEAL